MTTIGVISPSFRAQRATAWALQALAWVGAAAVLLLWWGSTGAVVGAGGWLTGAGRITGLIGGYACALLMAMMARVPALEQGVGSDRVALWHARLGRYTLSLILAHTILIIWGYSVQDGSSILGETYTIVFTYPEMIKATLGALIFLVIGYVSVRAVRRRISHELWYHLHLFTYLAIYLAFGHQLATGADFAANPVAQTTWYVLYLGSAALVLWYRVLTPIRFNLRHRLRVAAVHPETPGVYSIVLRGRRMETLAIEPGQFLRWRFLASGLWWTSAPYSLSAPPRAGHLRITVKAVGDHSTALARVRPGTAVFAEGPYGALTAARRTRRKVLLLAGGVGITPLRALFETIPAGPGELTLLYRARSAEDLALRGELETIATSRRAQLGYLTNDPDGSRPPITGQTLLRRVPDLAKHDVYLCGPAGMMDASYAALREAGVPARRIHHESFEL
jgi:ferredoxin-NADP reductase